MRVGNPVQSAAWIPIYPWTSFIRSNVVMDTVPWQYPLRCFIACLMYGFSSVAPALCPAPEGMMVGDWPEDVLDYIDPQWAVIGSDVCSRGSISLHQRRYVQPPAWSTAPGFPPTLPCSLRRRPTGKGAPLIGKQQRMGQGSRPITNGNKGFLSQVLYNICSKMRNTAPKSIKYRRYS